MKFCKDCDHFIRPHMGIAARCQSLDVGAAELPHVYAVHGVAYVQCTLARSEGHACGPEGQFHKTELRDALGSWFTRLFPKQ